MSKLIKVFTTTLLLVTLGGSVSAQPHTSLREGDKLDGIAAVVGKYPILSSSVDAQVLMIVAQSGKGYPSQDTIARIRKQVLQAEIDNKVLVVRAEQDTTIFTNESEIDERIEQQLKQYERKYGSRAEMERVFGKKVAEISSSPELRERARESILIEKLKGSHFSRALVISKRDVQDFYALYKDSLPRVGSQVELATIVKLVKPDPLQKEKLKAFARSLVDSLRNGASFSDYAARYSQHSTAKSGGDLGGPYPRGTFISDFESPAFKLKPSEISDPVETDEGIHIIKLIEKKGEEIRVAQILLKSSPSRQNEDSVFALIQSIQTRIKNGEDFSRMAIEYSDDQDTKVGGGVLGKVRVEELGPEQRGVIDSMSVGDVSRPVKIAYSPTVIGFQIVKLLARIEPHIPSPETDYRDIETLSTQWKMAKEFEKFVNESRKNVFVEVRNPSEH
ncbi:MAG: peptidylprolyl isomerase [bacterium]